MNLAVTFSAPYDTEGATGITASSTEVPDVYDVAVGGHPYMLDLKSQQFKHETIPTLRPVFVTADTNGEKNINPESLWRASQITWHKGAGQRHFDRADSDSGRFWKSKGVDPWTRWQIQLLPDTTALRASANSNLRMTTAGTYLYVTDGNALAYTTGGAFTTVTGTPAAAATGMCSDGYTIYTAYTGAGVYTTTRGAASATSFVTGTPTLTNLAYVKGRLMATQGRSVYNITATGALPTALFDHPNLDFQWVGFAAGQGFIYAAGFSGDKSLIYRVTIQPDGTALTIPTQAGELPDGETVRAIAGYLGFILIGTDKGVRLAQAASNGDLQIGALLTTAACRCFEGQDRFVWFGWDNYDSTSTGLGRIDLTIINDGNAPAYASDLMVTAQGSVTDVATFNGQRVLAVAGSGFYGQSTSYVPAGTIDSGLITFDLPDDKVAMYLEVKHVDPMPGDHVAYLAVDDGAFQTIGTHTSLSLDVPFTVPQLRGETFEIREQLDRGTDPTTTPVLTRHTLIADPAVDSGEFLFVPVLLAELLEVHAGGTRDCDVAGELAYLKGLRRDSTQVSYQEGATTYAVVVDDYQWVPTHLTVDGDAFNGTCVLKLKTV